MGRSCAGLAQQSLVRRAHAGIHHDIQTRTPRQVGSFLVDDPLLHPDHLGPNLDRLLDDWLHIFTPPEDIHHVDRLRYCQQIGIGLLAQRLIQAWVYGNDAIAVRL